MNVPDSLVVMFNIIVSIFLGLILPQGIGLLCFIYIRKNRFVRVITIFIPAIIFFIVSNIFWSLWANNIRESGRYACGALGAAATFSIIYGTILNLALALLIFWGTHVFLKKRAIALTPESSSNHAPFNNLNKD